ncbi:deoxyribose-phosphate aldolase [Flavobacterium rhizosphaerae]|uniref:Deoxyribose-phosphate aldolase n=1 Tax=Flavobacterium rhizosphaerae TaxID=3163298 RepID=A0ABW8YU64_9FLAO
MDIREYLDATYLKTEAQAGLSEIQNTNVVRNLVNEAIQQKYKLVMVRPDMVRMAVQMVSEAHSGVQVGTVIDFPEGDGGIDAKLAEAREAINNGADDLDFVVDYKAFKKGDRQTVAHEVLKCTQLCLENGKTAKWIIETAALTDSEIAGLSQLIKDTIVAHFSAEDYNRVFVKSSTGFYKTEDNKPNGATKEGIKIMIQNASPLPVKAAGGVRDYEEAIAMINLGVKRIGTSSAKVIVEGGYLENEGY